MAEVGWSRFDHRLRQQCFLSAMTRPNTTVLIVGGYAWNRHRFNILRWKYFLCFAQGYFFKILNRWIGRIINFNLLSPQNPAIGSILVNSQWQRQYWCITSLHYVAADAVAGARNCCDAPRELNWTELYLHITNVHAYTVKYYPI